MASRFARRFLLPPHHAYRSRSFSQEGEDIILERLFESEGKTDAGFYVDVGAHHPFRFSNTYLFYLKGWRGINIDAMPGSMKPFKQYRPEDTNLEAAISEKGSELTYYIFNEPALNGFSADLAMSRDGKASFRIVDRKVIKTQRLDEILKAHMPAGRRIDFLSVDVEGLDLEVLRSNDWGAFQPRFVIVEDAGTDTVEDALSGAFAKYLGEFGYRLKSKMMHSMIFRARDAETGRSA